MFKLTFRTDNAAFGDEPSYEVTRIVADVAERIGRGQTEGRVTDENGNTVGTFKLTKGGRR